VKRLDSPALDDAVHSHLLPKHGSTAARVEGSTTSVPLGSYKVDSRYSYGCQNQSFVNALNKSSGFARSGCAPVATLSRCEAFR
jgi:hypothetical protein